MQWLIDICKEAMTDTINALKAWVIARGYLTTGFVDRGDPYIEDFVTGDFTTDSAWHDLDLSGIVPKNAKAVLLISRAGSVTVGLLVKYRKKGNVNLWNASYQLLKVSLQAEIDDIVVPLDENQHIQYWFTSGTWSFITLTVKGWWF